jgi:glycosyltransferase involved in cell wall biosynthesis
MPDIFIVLATYNGERFLKPFLDSLCKQTRKIISVIAIDDGSKDSTISILESYSRKLPLSIHPQEQNRGHLAAFSLGLQIAKKITKPEDFIALADQDDIWLPQKLEILERSIGRADLVFGDATVIDAKGNPLADSWRNFAKIKAEISTRQYISGNNNMTGCLSLFKASLLDKILPIPDGIPVHDQWIALLAKKGNGIVSINDKICFYRLHGNNAVGLASSLTFSETLRTSASWQKVLLKNAGALHFSDQEIVFCKTLYELTEQRKIKAISLAYLPWIFIHRNDLFPHANLKEQIGKILFSSIGKPLAIRLFGKS